jgi:quercetin dioxygenase-like cupin family protein
MNTTKKAVTLTSVVLLPLGLGLGAAVNAAVTSQQVPTDTTNVHLKVVHTTADGFDSGWHVHPGPAIVQVEGGYFKIYQGDCAPKIVGPGETYVEVPNVPVRAIAKGAIEWTTTLVAEAGIPVARPTTPACPEE